MNEVIVIGAGLAGSEAAYQLAKRGVRVKLFEMRPVKLTPAHKTGLFAELVCSNSLKSMEIFNSHGLLKAELKRLDSLILKAAEHAAIPGGKALVVDREKFSRYVTETLRSMPEIEVINEEIKTVPSDGIVIIASGPLTSDALAMSIMEITGEEYLSFYDALSPIVDAESLDMSKLYFKDRYGWDDSSYLNAPMSEEEYDRFWEALVTAEVHKPHDFEAESKYFEGCLPIEEMAKRGRDTLRFGPLKPVGLPDPRTGKEPFAVVQLRRENAEGTAYSLVGFQTQLTYPEQRRVFRMIPGLEKAVFLRYGAVHRNTFVNAPRVLTETLQIKKSPKLFIAGQLSGSEGYVEAATGGLLSSLNAFRLLKGLSPVPFHRHTISGALFRYMAYANPRHFQPMNVNFGLMSDVPKMSRTRRKVFMVERALKSLIRWMEEHSEMFSESEIERAKRLNEELPDLIKAYIDRFGRKKVR